ncbi:MAG: penicillin acylase family protein [Planctomycetota bacterium]
MIAVCAVACAVTAGCVIRSGPPADTIDSLDRLHAFDGVWPGLREPASISWDPFAIPSIEAESASDAAYCLGLVHAHLRGVQISLLRSIAQGRLSESAGPFANPIDHAIRTIDLGRAVPAMEAALPDATRVWLASYAAGLSDMLATIRPLPAEAKSLALKLDEPWTVADVLLVARLASVDVTWGRWFSLLPLKQEAGYDDFIDRLAAISQDGLPSFAPPGGVPFNLFSAAGRTGSNAAVVAGSMTASGGALVASDPHLGFSTPGPWCVVGYRFGDHAVVGLTIPGLPFVVIGRNKHVAWTGTNMQSSSSVLYELDDEALVTNTERVTIRTRLWRDPTVELRFTEAGPVLSDASLLSELGNDGAVLKWRGHEPSDEATAFLRASTSRDWRSFREAFRTYAVGGQNMLFADASGNIGQIMALEAIPAAASAVGRGAVGLSDERFRWTPGVPSTELPAAFNPEEGFLVSANNTPTRFEPAIVPQGNANDRVRRMSDIIRSSAPVDVGRLAEMQRDTLSEASLAVAQAVSARATSQEGVRSYDTMLHTLGEWNGEYAAESTGAAAYQLVLDALIDVLYAERYADGIVSVLRRAPYVHDFVLDDVGPSMSDDQLNDALARASSSWREGLVWGDLHRLRLQHPVGLVPILGRSYRFEDLPWPGSTSTVNKSAHAVSGDRHRTTFGANARMLVDMSSADTNQVVLLGGQDGRVGSSSLLDQVPLWREGTYIPLPLTRAAQRRRAVRVSVLEPPAKTRQRMGSEIEDDRRTRD